MINEIVTFDDILNIKGILIINIIFEVIILIDIIVVIIDDNSIIFDIIFIIY